MRDTNNVTIVGRLTREPEFKTVADKTVAGIAIASNFDDNTDYFDVEYWGKGAEGIKPYLHKGGQIIVNGRLRQNRWEKDGKTMSRVSINAMSIQLLGGKSEAPASTPVDDSEDIPF